MLSRKHLGEKLLDQILPLFEVSEELARFAVLQKWLEIWEEQNGFETAFEADIPEFMQWLLSSNPEGAKALQY